MSDGADPELPTARSTTESIAALSARLDSIDRVADPVGWATAAYKLGMATAEEPSAQPQPLLQRALELYQQAADILSPTRAPVEHARILNAAGSAHRLLGDQATAARLFERSMQLLAGRGANAEEASVLNNLGLVLAERGRIDEAIARFTESLALLDGDGAGDDANQDDDVVRTRLATMHNLAGAHMGRGSADGLNDAIEVLQAASATAGSAPASLHRGLIDHSLGVAHKALAAVDPETNDQHLDRAIAAFERSLTIFTSVGFPMHHAIAKHNLGHALAGRHDLDSMRRALASYEDALNMFDPRLHQAHWQEAFKNIEALEARLAKVEPDAGRADHIATLAGSMSDDERLTFVRQRLLQMEPLPEKHRRERLTAFSYAIVTQPAPSFVATLRTLMTVLMELPETMLDSALRAQLQAHAMLDPHDQRAADFVLDEVIQALLFGPQRIRVRDMLADIGWDRP